MDNDPTAAKRILLVDDDETTVDSYARMLRLVRYDVSTALSAQEAFRSVEARPPDATLLDLRMPEVDGLRFLRALRARGAQTPVAIVTGVVEIDDAVQMELQQLQATIRWKPLWVEDLVALLTTLLA